MKSKGKNGKAAAKKAVHKHERERHPGEPMTKLPNGKPMMMKKK